ncbi:MAG: hypothetical protein ACO4AC_08945, partial [Pseudohongiellaceae bacterium]
MTFKLFPLLLLLLSGGLSAQENISTAGMGSKSIEMVRLAQEPEIDGVLDDEVWKQATLITDLYQVSPVEFATPTQETEIRI